MATPNTPFRLSAKSQQSVIELHKQCTQLMGQQYNLREKMRDVDLLYQRERDRSKENERAKVANKYGDSSKFQNITVPVVYPQVESAVQYQTSVFLTGHPIFGVVASPAFMDEALQMETVIADQQLRGGWVKEIMKAFRDGFKYNMGAVEVDWADTVTTTFETDISFGNGKQGRPKEIIWSGNRVRHLDMYNTFFDSRVPLTSIPTEGEFAGYTELISRIALKAMFASMPDRIVSNIVPAFNSSSGFLGTGASGGAGSYQSYFVPEINPDAFINKNTTYSTNWMAWAGLQEQDKNKAIAYKDYYERSVLYARILPGEFGINVPGQYTPQIWKFIIINHQVVVYAERMTNAHNLIPILFCQPHEDGLRYQSKSLAQNGEAFQSVSSALMNSMIHSRRRAISDRMLFDPSRVSEHHINSDNPSAKTPVRPSAYGKPVSDCVYPLPFRDDQAGLQMQEISQVVAFANQVSGQNPAKQGQFVKGNKTRSEYADVMGNANGRDEMVALLIQDQFFFPMKHIIKTNILQYQGGTSLFNPERREVVNVDPVKLRKAIMEFQVSDGKTPSEKLMDGEAFTVSLQALSSSPQIAAGYNVPQLFSYLMKARGADLRPFEKSPEQLAYEQAVMQWQQMATLAIEKEQPFNVPQPVPQQFGYNPGQAGAGPSTPAQAEVSTKINNITNNITNQ